MIERSLKLTTLRAQVSGELFQGSHGDVGNIRVFVGGKGRKKDRGDRKVHIAKAREIAEGTDWMARGS